MSARMEYAPNYDRPTRRVPRDEQANSVSAPLRRPFTPFGPTMTPDTVLGLQRTIGNRAVARMLAPTIQREPDPPTSDDGDVEMADAVEVAAQHRTSVGVLNWKAERIMDEAAESEGEVGDTVEEEAETSAPDAGAQLDEIVAEADSLRATIERDAKRADAATGGTPSTADVAPSEELPAEDEEAEFEDEDAVMTDAPSSEIDRTPQSSASTSDPTIQLARTKTRGHNGNYRKRASDLTSERKTEFLKKHTYSVYKTSSLRKDRRKAKKAARLLDIKDPSMLVFQPHIKKSGAVHPIWQILKASQDMYTMLEKLNAMKEHVRWFQHTHISGYTMRSMRAKLVPRNLMVGSNTSGTSEMYWREPVLNARKNSNSRPSSLYIKGHLLNDHMGGTGLAHNLVPLTADKAKMKTGSNDANGEHNREIEEPLKKLLMDSKKFEEVVTYRVDSLAPSPDSTRIDNTNQVTSFAKQFSAVAADMDDEDEDKTTSEIADEVEQESIDLDDGIGDDLLTAIGNGASLDPDVAATKLLDNAKLWHTENVTIPAGIKCTAYYLDTSGTPVYIKTKSGKDMNEFPIDNILPTKFTAPYKP